MAFDSAKKIGLPGRGLACIVDVAGGHASLLVVALYLVDGEGPTSPRNLKMLQDTGASIQQARMPFIVAGDFQCTPDQLLDTRWPQKIFRRGGSPRA